MKIVNYYYYYYYYYLFRQIKNTAKGLNTTSYNAIMYITKHRNVQRVHWTARVKKKVN